MEYNKLLQRLIRRNLKGIDILPEFEPIFKAISDSFDHYESDRNMLERSLDISSQELNRANSKIREALMVIEEKNKDIMDSINYARRIQQAILPSNELVRRTLPDSFVLFKPKDIVSGDFYWLSDLDDKVLFTAADCTGHGVPGAFMSMIGSSLLNEVVNEKGILHPNEILNEVRLGIITALKQTGVPGEQKDGMDAALCFLDKKTKTLAYSGAHNSLYIIRHNDTPLLDETVEQNAIEPNIVENKKRLYEVKADKQPVGLYTEDMQPFTNHRFKLEEGDSIYIFSDGYPDQFGGPKGKKFKSKQFKNLLLSIQEKPMNDQHEILDHTITEWMGDMEQIDDICVIGVRV